MDTQAQALADKLVENIRLSKSQIRRLRHQLGRDKATLLALQQECQQRGILLVVHHTSEIGAVKEDSHGRPQAPARPFHQ